jgi:hypothetical protein
METTVKQVGESYVDLKQGDDGVSIPGDGVMVRAGGQFPTLMLKKLGFRLKPVMALK